MVLRQRIDDVAGGGIYIHRTMKMQACADTLDQSHPLFVW